MSRSRVLAVSLITTFLPTGSFAEENSTPPRLSAWTVLVYGAVDNDWERPFMSDVRAMRRGLSGVDDVEVVLLVDRSPEYSSDARALGDDFADSRLYRLTGGAAERLDGTPELPLTKTSAVELDLGDAATLGAFVKYGKAHYPARHYALFLVSHGEGMRFCPDETNDDAEIFTAELTEHLTEAESVDLLGFDACLMAGVENAYEWRRRPGRFGADILLAAAPVSSSWPYQEIFARIGEKDDLAPGAFASIVIDELDDQIREGRSGDEGIERDLQAWGAFDLSKVEEAKQRLDALAACLFLEEEKADLIALRGKGLEADTFVYVWPERDADVNMPFVDLCHLCERIAESDAFSDPARALAADAAEAAAAIVTRSVGFDHYDGFAPGRHGLYLVFPDGDQTTRRGATYWERTEWYSPLRVRTDDGAYGRYAWCADGSIPGNGEVETWFELMDAWFDAPGAEGGGNGYAW